MYPEFVAIYVGLAVLAALMTAVLILLIKLMRQPNAKSVSKPYISQTNNLTAAPTNAPTGNIVFCKHCAAEFDSSQRVCPKCGTPR